MTRYFRRLAAVVLLCGALAGCASCSAGAEAEEALTVTFLDVGKGDCILVEKDGAFLLLDAGLAGTADDVIASLRQAGAERLDYFIITHYDKDHVGGAARIAESFPIGRIYLPGYEGSSDHYLALRDVIAEKGLAAQNVAEDVSFTLAGVGFDIYASPLEYIPGNGEEEGNDNDVSLVIAARWGEDSYLFAGDLEKEGIERFLAAGHGPFDVVKMPHHGRKESNTDDFLAAVQPRIAVITDSEDDGADKKVINLLEAAEADVYRSSQCGDIVVTGTGGGAYAVSTGRGADATA